jgi:hypothetical protein
MMMTTPTVALALALSATAFAAPPAAPAPKSDPKMALGAEKASEEAATLVAQTRADIQKDRNAIVGAAMDLTDASAGPFRELYAQAARLLTDMLSIQKQEASTKPEWAAKFQAKLPGKFVARFFQVDNKLDAIIHFQLAAEVPLVE